jgi:hypothetical protein
MKKFTLLIMVLMLTAILAVSPVYAKGEDAKGAVKVDLVEVLWDYGPPGGPPFIVSPGDVVGSAILNTTASGKLNVLVNMDTEPNLEDYDIFVSVFYSPPPFVPPSDAIGIFGDILNTNAQGQGNAQVKVDIDPPQTNSSIWVVVVVREQPTVPYTPPDYFNMPPPVEVPLK